jgi:hypothetical protein
MQRPKRSLGRLMAHTYRLITYLLTLLLVACASTAEASPSPAPSPADTTAPSPSPTASPPPGPTTSPDPTLSPSPTPTPTDTPVGSTPTPASRPTPSFAPAPSPSEGWTGPSRVSERPYLDPSIVVDAVGIPHVAVVLQQRTCASPVCLGSIYHLTNESGAWTRERITRPPQAADEEDVGFVDGEPSIAIDGNGSLWVAFTRMFDFENFGPYPEGVYVVNNSSGSWSNPIRLAGDAANLPSLQVRDGRIYVAYVQGRPTDAWGPNMRFAIMYGTDKGGSFATTRVARHGARPQLRLDGDGRPHLLYQGGRSIDEHDGLYYATGASAGGSFTVELVGDTSGEEHRWALALDSDGRPHAAWSIWPAGTHYARRSGSGWLLTENVLPTEWRVAMAMGASGTVHVAGGGEAGVHYATNRSGDFVSERLTRQEAMSLGLAVDASGRPHLVFIARDDDFLPRGLWYGVGPAD